MSPDIKLMSSKYFVNKSDRVEDYFILFAFKNTHSSEHENHKLSFFKCSYFLKEGFLS